MFLPIFFSVALPALGQSYEWSSASETSVKNMDKLNNA